MAASAHAASSNPTADRRSAPPVTACRSGTGIQVTPQERTDQAPLARTRVPCHPAIWSTRPHPQRARLPTFCRSPGPFGRDLGLPGADWSPVLPAGTWPDGPGNGSRRRWSSAASTLSFVDGLADVGAQRDATGQSTDDQCQPGVQPAEVGRVTGDHDGPVASSENRHAGVDDVSGAAEAARDPSRSRLIEIQSSYVEHTGLDGMQERSAALA